MGGKHVSSVLNSVSTTIPAFVNGSPTPNLPGGPGSLYTPSGGSGGFSSSVAPTFGLVSIAGALVVVLAVLFLLATVGVFIIVVVANRADPDPTGRRPQSVYFFAVSFVTILVSIISSAVVVGAVLQLIGSHSSSITNTVARTVVLGGLLALLSLFLLITHLRRGLVLARADAVSVANPSRRVGQSYVAAVTFVSVLLLLVTAVLAVYLVFALAGPGVFGSFGGRGPALRVLVEAVYIGGIAGVVIWTHRHLVEPGLSWFGPATGSVPPPSPPTAAFPVPESRG